MSWIVSHCNTQSRRDQYVKSMEDVIHVDVYGHCGNLDLTRVNLLLRTQNVQIT